MAITLNVTLNGSTVCTYHRIGEVRVLSDKPLVGFVLESFADQDARAEPGVVPVRTEFVFPYLHDGDLMSRAYAALLANPLWSAATPDVTVSSIPGTGQAAITPGAAQWDDAAQAWGALYPSLDDVKAQKLAEIDDERETRNNEPISFNGSTFDSDAKAQKNVMAWMAALAAGVSVPAGFVWRDADNVDHPADAAFVNGLGAAMAMRGTQLYQQAWALKAQVQACTTPDQVAAISWPIG